MSIQTALGIGAAGGVGQATAAALRASGVRVLASGRGSVDMLAVAMSERHRGLGRALLLHAFADLQLAGSRDLTLGVEAENAAALGLYRSVGLEVEREWRIYATASNDAYGARHQIAGSSGSAGSPIVLARQRRSMASVGDRRKRQH